MDDSDRKFRDLLQRELPKERKDPWFTNKVLNRLPPHRKKANYIEKWLVFISCMMVIVGLALESAHILTAPYILVRDLVMIGILVLSAVGLTFWILYPQLKNL